MTSGDALDAIKAAVAAGRFSIGIGDMAYSNIQVFDVEEAVDFASSCARQGTEWVLDGPDGSRFVFAIEGKSVVVTGHQR